MLGALLDAYFNGEVSKIAQGQQKIPEGAKFYPFSVSARSSNMNIPIDT